MRTGVGYLGAAQAQVVPELGLCVGGCSHHVSCLVLCGGAGANPAALSTSHVASQITRLSCFPAQDFVGAGAKRLGLIVLSSMGDFPFTADWLSCCQTAT